jgi:hypothetical protein
VIHMRTIDWPLDLTQTYVNASTPDRKVIIDDDHQAVGKHTLEVDAASARRLADAHRDVADALDAAADALDSTTLDVPSAPPAPPSGGEEGA